LLGGESDKCPPIGAFCEFAMCLYTPNLNNLGAKSPIVSNPYGKYSRFLETRAGDRVRSALRGVGRSTIQLKATEFRSEECRRMSAFGGKAEVARRSSHVRV
jgi:hypothetical protein